MRSFSCIDPFGDERRAGEGRAPSRPHTKRCKKADLDPKKQVIVNHVDGPLLVIAGPGAGKTMAIVERVVRLVGVSHVAPELIFVSTFSRKQVEHSMTFSGRELSWE